MTNLLITGATQQDRFSYAIDLTKKYLCPHSEENYIDCQNCLRINTFVHPNLYIVGPDNLDGDFSTVDSGEIKLEQVFRIIEENNKKNFSKGYAIYLITHAHCLTIQAANALLKTIEENNKNKLIFLLAPSRSSVLPTISSRLTLIRIKPKNLDINIKPELFFLIENISKTKPHLRLSFVDNFSLEKHELIKQLQDLLQALHILLYDKTSKKLSFLENLKVSKAVFNAQKFCKRNINTKLIIEEMLFNKWPFFAMEKRAQEML